MPEFLTADQLQEWEANGYLVIPDFASAEACDSLMERAKRIVSEAELDRGIFTTGDQKRHADSWFLESADKVRVFMELEKSEGHNVNKIGHALHDLDPVFGDFCRNERLAAIAIDVGFRNPLLLQSMYIFKQPKTGGEVSIHQDSSFLYTEPMSCVGFWFALEDATLENGCLWAKQGGHKLPLTSRFVRNGKGGCEFEEYDIAHPELDEFVALPVPAGSLVLLHGNLPHYSAKNLSDKSREAFALHIIEGEFKYDERNWLQRSEKLPLRGF